MNNRTYKTGTYTLKNPEKFKGTKVPMYKSSFECRVFYWCDENTKVLEWSYEPIVIDYNFSLPTSAPDLDKSLVDNKSHKYYPDLIAVIKTNDSQTTNFLIEIKPYSQTIRPTEPKKKTKKSWNKYCNALQEFLKNSVKWEAAEKYAKKNGMVFTVVTERQIFT